MCNLKVFEIENICYSYPDGTKALKEISFSVNEGEIFSIIGLNGAGKTTIMKCLLGLLDYDSGKVDIFGKGNLKKESKSLIGYLPEISYYPKSIKLNILMEYYSELYGIKDYKLKISESLEKVGLLNRENSKLEEFSKGMLQKVGIAQAILNSPKLLFLDEPMSGLDPLARREVIDLLKELKAMGTTIFLNTHILGDIESVGDRGIIVHKGRVLDSFNLHEKRKEEGYNIVLKNGISYNVSIEELDRKVKELKDITEIRKNHFSLEEYFKNTVLGGKE